MMQRLAATVLNHVPSRVAGRLTPNSLAARAMRPIVNRIVSPGAKVVAVRSGRAAGLLLMIELRSEKYYWTGSHEPHLQDALVSSLRQGDVYWDVGAHIGFTALLAARVVGASGSVVAFEPMTATRARLSASIAASGATNVSVEPLALTSSIGPQMLHAAQATTMWSLRDSDDRRDGDGETVMCSTLDAMAVASAIPDVIKIDAEGVEVEVLRGGLGMIAANQPTLLVEFSSSASLAEGRRLLPDSYDWSHLGANHWLLTPVTKIS